MSYSSEILKLIGSMNKLSVMIGAKDFVALPKGMQFDLKRAKNKINKISISLENDEYSIKFGNFSKSKCQYVIVKYVDGIQAENLKSVLESELGLYLNL